jgi:hypothetical protein
MDIGSALDKVNSGEFAAAFFLNPTCVDDVEKAALSAVRMPPKSTYFYPKLLTGLVSKVAKTQPFLIGRCSFLFGEVRRRFVFFGYN